MKSRIVTACVALGLALAVAAPLATPVLAHAELLRSIPEANAALERAPAQIELFMSEPLEPSFSTVSVLDSNGLVVDNGDARVDPLDATRLSVSIRSLPDGVYTVSWKALSSVDGHVTTGAFPFAVGDVDAAELAAAGSAARQVKLSLGEIAARWLTFVSALTLAGGTLFVLVVWRPAFRAARQGKASFDAPWATLSRLAILLMAAASVLALLTQAGQVTGSEIAPPWSSAFNSVLFNTRYGALWLARMALLFAIAAFLPEAGKPGERWAAFGLALALLLTISLGSHAAAEPQPLLPVASDWIHLVAASVWVGGLTHFVAGMWAARSLEPSFRTRLTATLIPRFSALALVSVGALTLTGLYASALRLGSFQALNDTIYGRTLLVKLILALPMVALGAVNLLGITPVVKQAAARKSAESEPVETRFRRLITSEVTIGLVLLLSVGVLTALPPARATATTPVITGTHLIDDLQIELSVTPGKVGLNTFELDLNAGGQPVLDARETLLRFTPASGKVPPSEAILAAQGDGRYTVKGSFLSLADDWQVQAVVRRPGRFDAYANFDMSVGGAAGLQSYPWHRVAGGLLLVGALAYLYAMSVLGHTQAQLIGYGIVPALLMAVASVFVFFTEPPRARSVEIVNPIPPNLDSVAAGQALYQTNCVPCHGVSGKGDGPVGLTLSPRPADLEQHAIPGVHTDGQLYLWISDGFPGTVMPAFRGSLSDDERWHLVNFIRTFAPQ